ncbi:MAG: hypothetical protein H5U40_02275, partial [Polyangiaceae bacterium]|nr:hypothetical protein [Polyangiaceae bacterium]
RDLRTLEAPPKCGCLDALATRLEGGGRGVPVEAMVDLRVVLGEDAHRLASAVERFYSAPLSYRLRAGVRMGWWSRTIMALFTAFARQMRIPEGGRALETYPVDQRLYQDAIGRLHWDRYVYARGSWRRLFTARIAVGRGVLRETFVSLGLPLTLTFRASAEDGALVLRLDRAASSLPARLCQVEYRTSASDEGIVTRGDFRIPRLGVRVRTEFRGAYGQSMSAQQSSRPVASPARIAAGS